MNQEVEAQWGGQAWYPAKIVEISPHNVSVIYLDYPTMAPVTLSRHQVRLNKREAEKQDMLQQLGGLLAPLPGVPSSAGNLLSQPRPPVQPHPSHIPAHAVRGGVKQPSTSTADKKRLTAEQAAKEFKRRAKKIILSVLDKIAPNHVYASGKDHMVQHLLEKVFAKETKHLADISKIDLRCSKVARYVTEYVTKLRQVGKF